MIQINAGTRLHAADTDDKKTIKVWIGTNGRYAEVVLVAELLLVMAKSKAESIFIDPQAKKAAQNIVANKACVFKDCVTWVKACNAEVKSQMSSALSGSKDSLASAQLDYKSED